MPAPRCTDRESALELTLPGFLMSSHGGVLTMGRFLAVYVIVSCVPVHFLLLCVPSPFGRLIERVPQCGVEVSQREAFPFVHILLAPKAQYSLFPRPCIVFFGA
ncbi:uncharacterized protein TM35_000131990 [Trypanosoma theileri]|uniref:Transmembrane protein n=1 Tax=Trypanosoma theileri TaxID=67003 RepID=A0A1X0NWX2_9TRYP|nr:uncharacterized protein TM35_000131990 [Trypanosoma theileri]ORC89195.1 hypothetical protein TM35_000131990 [Trypanosoma theileri]